jgi:hypothetical protein
MSAPRLRVEQAQEQAEARDHEAKGHDRDARTQPGQHRPFGGEVHSGIIV